MSEWAKTTKIVTQTQEIERWSVDYSASPFPSASQIQSSYQNKTTSRGSSGYSFYSFSLPPILVSLDGIPDQEIGGIIEQETQTTDPSSCEPCDPMGGVWMLSPDEWNSQIVSTEPGGIGNANFKFSIMWRKTSGSGPEFFESTLLSESLPLPLKKEKIIKTRILDGYSSCLCVPYPAS